MAAAAKTSSASAVVTLGDRQQLLTVREVAAMLRLTEKGVYSLVAGRKIPYLKISNRVRFLYSDVLAFLSEHRVSASERSR